MRSNCASLLLPISKPIRILYIEEEIQTRKQIHMHIHKEEIQTNPRLFVFCFSYQLLCCVCVFVSILVQVRSLTASKQSTQQRSGAQYGKLAWRWYEVPSCTSLCEANPLVLTGMAGTRSILHEKRSPIRSGNKDLITAWNWTWNWTGIWVEL